MLASIRNVSVFALIAAAMTGMSVQAVAQPLTTGFTYQGELKSAGAPATGTYDIRFRLYDAALGVVQVGSTVCRDNVSVTDGQFTVELDFGAVFAGAQRWIEIDVRQDAGLGCGDSTGFTTLGPRRSLTATPYAVYSSTAANSVNFNGQNAAFYQNATNINSGTLNSARLSGVYANSLTLNNAANSFTGTFTGSGAGLSNLSAANITSGTLSDLRLSTNVALLNTAQTFTAPKTFAPAAGTPVSIATAGLGGIALNIANSGGSSILVNNTAGGAIGYGLNLNLDGTSFKYGVLMDITGDTGVGYGVLQNNSTVGGRGYYANMTGTGTTHGVYVVNNNPAGYGGYFNNTATTGVTYGLYCENNSADGYGLFALHDASTGTGPAVYGRSDSTSANAFGIHGVMTAATGGSFSTAVRGESQSTGGGGVGVWGSHAGSGYGVYGTSVDGRAVYGFASDAGRGVWGQSVNGYGVYGFSSSTYGGYFDTGVSGGTALYVNGTASVGVITIRGGADLAEDFEAVTKPEELTPGMVVMIDPDHTGGIKLASGTYNKCVAGVISGANGLSAAMVMGQFEGQINGKPVALSGRVWTMVDATETAVEPGDLLTTSATPGHAMVASDASRSHGATIGKAMSRLAKGEKGMVLVLVNLQ
jgi:hypothetical protein